MEVYSADLLTNCRALDVITYYLCPEGFGFMQSIDHVLATRRLGIIDGGEVIVTVGVPRQLGADDDYCCYFQIIGVGRDAINHANGVDLIQALLLALKKIGSILKTCEAGRAGKLYWLSPENHDIGFPLPDILQR